MSDAIARREQTAWFGAVLALGSAAMLFVALFFAYAFLRARTDAWPPPGLPHLPRRLPTLNLAIAAAGSGFLRRARTARAPRASLRLALGCAVSFAALQVVLWHLLLANGFTFAQTGAYGAVFYGLTFVHAAHVLVGIAGVASLLGRASPLRLRLWSLYWDFLAAVWMAVVVGVIWL